MSEAQTEQALETVGRLEQRLEDWRTKLKRASHRLLSRSVRRRADTSDIVQEGMIQVWQSIDRIEESSVQESAGLTRRIARGHAAKVNRRHHAKKRAVLKTERSLHEPICDNDPSRTAENNEQVLMVMEALQKLDASAQRILYLAYFENKSIAEISREFGESYKVVRRKYMNSIETLRKLIDR